MNTFDGVKITDLTLPFVKEYLKVDYEDEDKIIGAIAIGAKGYIETMLGFKISKEWPNKMDIPDELTVACLLLIAHWFDNRQMQTAGLVGDEINYALSALIDAHKIPLKDSDIETEDNGNSEIIIPIG